MNENSIEKTDLKDLLYVDANVYLDVFLHNNSLEEGSLEFFWKVLRRGCSILVSDWVCQEVYGKIRESGCADVPLAIAALENHMVFVSSAKEDWTEAGYGEGHWQDKLHCILARKGGASSIVTRNTRDFEDQDLSVTVEKPEEVWSKDADSGENGLNLR